MISALAGRTLTGGEPKLMLFAVGDDDQNICLRQRTCAVIARNWHYLDPLRSLCECERIPAQVACEDTSLFCRLRPPSNRCKAPRERARRRHAR